MTDVQVPQLPPNWYYEFQVIQSDYSNKSFQIVLKNGNVKMGSDKIWISQEATPKEIGQKFDESLEQLAKDAWAMENPDEQWAEINKYRWAINQVLDDLK